MKALSNIDCFLPGHRVGYQQDLFWPDTLLDSRNFGHHLLIYL